jgi:diacylglycerol O-acyltransferase / wax synthase
LNSSKKDGPAPKGKNFFSLGLEIIVCFLKVLGNAASKYDSDILFTSQNKPALKMTGTKRKAIFFPTTKLDFLKRVKNKANVTINDVLLAATSGAIRRYCEKRGDPLIGPGKTSVNRALLPVAFPRSDKELQNPSIAMRNKWACVSSELPIDKLTCAERLEASSKSMTFLKKSPMAYVQLWVQTNLLPLLPRFLSQNTALDLFKRHSMVFSNLPGPTNHYYFGRQKVVGFQVRYISMLHIL